jgi:hypothetical protein
VAGPYQSAQAFEPGLIKGRRHAGRVKVRAGRAFVCGHAGRGRGEDDLAPEGKGEVRGHADRGKEAQAGRAKVCWHAGGASGPVRACG